MTALPQRSSAAPGPTRHPATADRVRDPELLRSVLAGLTARDDVEACAGELLIHADGRVECLDDPRCATDPALHVGVVRCADALGDCCSGRATA